MAEHAIESRLVKDRALWMALRAVAWLGGVLALVYALTSASFRDAEGFLQGTVCLPLSIAVALFLLGVFLRQRAFASWLALALIGQAVALQLIEAGKGVRYQHYKPFDRLLAETHPLLLLFLLAQTVLVLSAFHSRWPQVRAWLGRSFKPWQLVGIGLTFSLFSATVSHDIARYLGELVWAAFIQAINLLTIVLVVWHIPEGTRATWRERFDRLLGAPDAAAGEQQRRGVPTMVWLAALWVFGAAAVLNLVSYQAHPHVADEFAYLYQARFLAEGVLTMPAPPAPEAFDVYLMQFDGARWYPVTPPGWPAVLSLGVKLGAPWLVNPFLGGLNVILAYALLSRLYTHRTARIATLLLSLSPWAIFMSMNFMTHTLTLTCALVGALGVVWARETGKARWAWLAGGAIGLMSLIRPLEGLIIAALLGLWAIGLGGRRLKLASILGLVVGTALIAGLALPFNQALTGKASEFPINAYTDERFGKNANALGFGPDRGMGWAIDPNPGHSPVDGLINANLNLFQTNVELFGWSTGSLLLLGLALFSGRIQKSDILMLAAMSAVFIVFFLYYFSGGPDFGARYWYLMIVPFVALSARGIQVLEHRLASSRLVLAGVLLLSALALINFLPWRAIDKYFHYLGMRPDIRALEQQAGFGESVILVRGEAMPDYASAAVYNPVDMYARAPIYARLVGPETRAQLVAAYPGRPIWVVDGPSITGAGYSVVEGPR
jgi:4-amino-4-deoxy-L-arabinose transferase-like glycosyltransferase